MPYSVLRTETDIRGLSNAPLTSTRRIVPAGALEVHWTRHPAGSGYGVRSTRYVSC